MREIWKDMRSIYPKCVFTELNVSKIYASIESRIESNNSILVPCPIHVTDQIVVSVKGNCQVFIGAETACRRWN